MQIHTDLSSLPKIVRPVLTIGSFDGVHCGHQCLLQILNERAARIGGESLVITFEPHPRLIVAHNEPFYILSTIEEKIRLLNDTGIAHLCIVRFDDVFSSMSPIDYLEHFIYQTFSPVEIVIGYDHRFGKGRSGDIILLQQFFLNKKVKITEVDPVLISDIAISSTRIRNALHTGDIESARLFSGHPYLIRGDVVQGDKIGRTIGFPTANLRWPLDIKLIPPDGIYAAEVEIDDKKHPGMAYIGNRPVLGQNLNKVIEVNIFDFNQDIYNQSVNLWLHSRIREDRSLTDLIELKMQLAEDRRQVMQYFTQNI